MDQRETRAALVSRPPPCPRVCRYRAMADRGQEPPWPLAPQPGRFGFPWESQEGSLGLRRVELGVCSFARCSDELAGNSGCIGFSFEVENPARPPEQDGSISGRNAKANAIALVELGGGEGIAGVLDRLTEYCVEAGIVQGAFPQRQRWAERRLTWISAPATARFILGGEGSAGAMSMSGSVQRVVAGCGWRRHRMSRNTQLRRRLGGADRPRAPAGRTPLVSCARWSH